jgi:hypothetical protein
MTLLKHYFAAPNVRRQTLKWSFDDQIDANGCRQMKDKISSTNRIIN